MKALSFLPFTFAAGAEGFALFAAYLVSLLSVLYLARTSRQALRPICQLRTAAPLQYVGAA